MSKKQKKKQHIPSGVDRISQDRELVSAIKLYISLGHTVEEAARAYRMSESMIKYCIKQNINFDDAGNINHVGGNRNDKKWK